MLSNADRVQLKAGKLFSSVGLDEVGHLLDACIIETIEAGVHLLEAGGHHSYLYMVLDGELLVYPGGADLSDPVVLGVGDCAGEMSLIGEQHVSALVVPSRETRLLAIHHDILWTLVARSHRFARNLLDILAGRHRNDNPALVGNSQAHSLEFELAVSVDALTGLHNQRWMYDAFTRVMQRCERDAAPVCLVLVVIDNFRSFNGSYGHSTADGLLRLVAQSLVDGLRPQDLLVRYGGEVFALMLPETSFAHGSQVAERLRLSVAAHAVPAGDDMAETVTISCGIASMETGDTLDTLLAAAGDAVKVAKQNGRNRVEKAVRQKDGQN